jgi:hypothetical protein
VLNAIWRTKQESICHTKDNGHDQVREAVRKQIIRTPKYSTPQGRQDPVNSH